MGARSMTKPTDATRRDMTRRDQGRCVSCGTTDGLSYQHRANDGMGGSLRIPGVAEGVTACVIENTEWERSLQTVALAYGWKIKKWADPLRVPIYVAHEFTWYRLEGVERHRIDAITALDMMYAVYGDQYAGWLADASDTQRHWILKLRGGVL